MASRRFLTSVAVGTAGVFASRNNDVDGRRGRGTYLMPSFGRYEQAAELVRRIRARQPRTDAGAATAAT